MLAILERFARLIKDGTARVSQWCHSAIAEVKKKHPSMGRR